LATLSIWLFDTYSPCGDMHQSFTDALVMAAVWNGARHYIFALWFLLLSFYLFSSPNLRADVAGWMSSILPHMVWP